MVTWKPGESLSARPTASAPECGAPITKTGWVTLRALTMRMWRGGIFFFQVSPVPYSVPRPHKRSPDDITYDRGSTTTCRDRGRPRAPAVIPDPRAGARPRGGGRLPGGERLLVVRQGPRPVVGRRVPPGQRVGCVQDARPCRLQQPAGRLGPGDRDRRPALVGGRRRRLQHDRREPGGHHPTRGMPEQVLAPSRGHRHPGLLGRLVALRLVVSARGSRLAAAALVVSGLAASSLPAHPASVAPSFG